MLTERTNILLDKETRQLLLNLAKKQKRSMGELIRCAVQLVYKGDKNNIIKQRTKVVKNIQKLQKKIKPTRGINYRDFVEYGRYR